MTLLCEGAGSHFVLEHSLVIYVMWPSALVTSCNTFGKNSCILVVSQPLGALCRSAFSNLPQRVSGHVIPLYGGVSKSSRSPCISSTRSMEAVK